MIDSRLEIGDSKISGYVCCERVTGDNVKVEQGVNDGSKSSDA